MTRTLHNPSTVQSVADEIVHWFDRADLDRSRWTADAQVDVWQPGARIQATGVDTIDAIYRSAYPTGQEVTWSSAVATERGVLVEFTVRSRDSEHRFAKECAVVDTDPAGLITKARIHCTGEWSAAGEQAFLAQGGSLEV